MKITRYETFLLQREPVSGDVRDRSCRHSVTDRGAGAVYLYNRAHQLVRVLRLADYGVVDRRRGIPHKDRVIEVADGPRARVELDPELELLCTWHEELGLSLFEFDGARRFHLPGPYCHAQFDRRGKLLWTVRRESDTRVTVLLYDFEGALLASLEMEDPLSQSEFHFQPLPRRGDMAVCFAAGQDGSQSCFLSLDGGLAVTRTLPPDRNYLFDLNGGSEALLLDFYDMVLYRCTFPGLEEIATFAYPAENWCVGDILPLGGGKLVLSNDCDYRHYLFDLHTMRIEEEIEVEGYPLREDSGGMLCSDFERVELQDGRMVFHVSRNEGGQPVWKRLVAEIPLP